MPAQPLRATPSQRANAAFTADDVTAFRLRPLGHISTSASAPTTAINTTSPPLPTLSTATAKIPKNTPAGTHRTLYSRARTDARAARDGVAGATSAVAGLAASYPNPQKRSARGGEAVDEHAAGVALPNVYAVLHSAAEASCSPVTCEQHAASSPAVGDRGGEQNDRKDALIPTGPTSQASLVRSPLQEMRGHGNETDSATDASAAERIRLSGPRSHDIPPPSMRPAEARALAQWTSDVSATRDAAVIAAQVATNIPTVNTAPTPVDTSVLYSWWRDRLTHRQRHRHYAALSTTLSTAVEAAVRSTLTAEEAYWQQQHSATLARGVLSGTSAANTCVPSGKMEPLMPAVQLTLHQTAVAFVEAQLCMTRQAKAAPPGTSLGLPLLEAQSDATSSHNEQEVKEEEGKKNRDVDAEHVEKEEEVLSRAEREEVLQATLHTERALAHETKTARSAPSLVTLPVDTPVLPPVLRMETAAAVTLLSRILEQAEAATPGATFALQLLHRFVLPHVYSDYAAWTAVRPGLGNLSEQTTHLATLPLRVEQHQQLAAAAQQAHGDTRYLEAVVRGWTMRSWLRWITAERQRVAQFALFARTFDRLHRRLRLQRVVATWQRRTRDRQQQRQETNMESAYTEFLAVSKATVGVEGAGQGTSGALPLLSWRNATATAITVPSVGGAAAALLKRRASTASKKPGAGHSRVYLSFMRPQNSKTSPSQPAVLAATDRAKEDTMGAGETGVERFVVRNSDSEEDEGDPDRDDEGEGGGDDGDDRSERSTGPRVVRSGDGMASFKSIKSVKSVAHSSVMKYLHSPKPEEEEDDAFPTFLDAADGDDAAHPAKGAMGVTRAPGGGAVAPSALFTTMLTKLQELEQVNLYLRKELDVQSRRLRKAEADNTGLRQRNKELEDGTLRLVRDRLEACNVAQQHNAVIVERNRQIRQLRSRLRGHRHRPWQQAVMRLVGDVCAVSTDVAERADDARVRRDRFGVSEAEKSAGVGGGDDVVKGPAGWAKAGRPLPVGISAAEDDSRGPTGPSSTASAGAHGDAAAASTAAAAAAAVVAPSASPVGALENEERLFGRIAPIVLQSTKQLPEAHIILADWANSCLDDLQQLDDLTGGPFATRFAGFSEEARSGVLFSRLLYYLALPRYRAQTSAADASVDMPNHTRLVEEEETSQTVMGHWAGINPRRQLLEQHGVQLDPPYPVFEDCFNDIMTLPPPDRMMQLLSFATELMTSRAGDPVDLPRDAYHADDAVAAAAATAAAALNSTAQGNTSAATAGTTVAAGKKGDVVDEQKASAQDTNGTSVSASAAAAPPSSSTVSAFPTTPQPATPLPLHTVLDPYALARGDSSAVTTFIALLYVRFAHPFHHKSRLSAMVERRMLLLLWSDGDATAEELAGPLGPATGKTNVVDGDESQTDSSLLSLQPTSKEETAAWTPVSRHDTDSTSSLADKEDNGRLASISDTSLPLLPPLPPAAATAATTNKDEGVAEPFSIEAEMLRQLAPEDKTPWQLFRERCLPAFGTQAHPFLLRGGFWPAEAFDTPELAAMLGALAMALHRSLELHRWHITLSCLVPVRTYGGLSRGVFTGPNASPAALELGLRQDGQEWLCFDFPTVHSRIEARQAAFRAATLHRSAATSPLPQALLDTHDTSSGGPSTFKPASSSAEIQALLSTVTGVWQEDLLSLFTQRAALSPQLALPVLDLGSWRLLCNDLGLIDLSALDDSDSDEDEYENNAYMYNNEPNRPHPHSSKHHNRGHSFAPRVFSSSVAAASPKMQPREMDMEVVTLIFQKAVMAISQARDEVDPAIYTFKRYRSVGASRTSPQLSPAANPWQCTPSMAYVLDVSVDSTHAEEEDEGDVDDATHTGNKTRTNANQPGHASIPDLQMDMTYAAFVLALAFLADELFPGAYVPREVSVPMKTPTAPLATSNNNNNNNSHSSSDKQKARQHSHGGGGGGGDNNNGESDANAMSFDLTDAPSSPVTLQYCSLSMAFAEMMRCVVLISPVVHLHPNDPRSVLRRLTSGVPTQLVLNRHAPALLLVYQTYSKDVFGEVGMLREDVLRVLRDAMLTGADLSQYLIFDLFASCAVLRQASEETAVGVRRDVDGRLRPDVATAAAAARRPGYRAVRIVDPSANTDNSAVATAQRKRAYVLTFEGFCDLVCVLCSFKQPNVFVPFEERLLLFLRRSLLRPLTHTVAGLGALMAQSQPVLEASVKEAPVASAAASESPTASPAERPLR